MKLHDSTLNAPGQPGSGLYICSSKYFCTLAQIHTVKQTLLFENFEAMITFSKQLEHGYLLNTVNYTLTGFIPEEKLAPVLQAGSARLISTTDKVFSYHQVS